jgi:hypothetical protein
MAQEDLKKIQHTKNNILQNDNFVLWQLQRIEKLVIPPKTV